MTAASVFRPARRPIADRVFRAVTLLCGMAVLAVLVLIVYSMTKQALPAFRAAGAGFVTSDEWVPNAGKFGALAFIYGTLVISAIALVLAVPLSVGIALFLTEVAPRRLRQGISYAIDLLAAVPSVVFGLWGLLVLSPLIVKLYADIASGTEGVPVLGTLFGGPVNGKSFFTAGIVLALMITPIITLLVREVFDTVPPGQKEAALALGATRWEMIRQTVFPHSRAGVIGAVMLGLGRAMGETIAAALVIGSSPQLTARLFGAGDAMAAVIANQFGEAGGTHRSALIGLGVVLFFVTVLVNIAAQTVVRRMSVHEGAAT
ncbi:MAG TPA: phosphate ABC transporter permease subunit PstC [Acidimicrobiales bacterium]|nr:phosphate ABC transporter permease subunit PstC [Acidimicrobiales bacterium]